MAEPQIVHALSTALMGAQMRRDMGGVSRRRPGTPPGKRLVSFYARIEPRRKPRTIPLPLGRGRGGE